MKASVFNVKLVKFFDVLTTAEIYTKHGEMLGTEEDFDNIRAGIYNVRKILKNIDQQIALCQE